jgi:multisubunit Na+/H+ antiporter MnhB subunit
MNAIQEQAHALLMHAARVQFTQALAISVTTLLFLYAVGLSAQTIKERTALDVPLRVIDSISAFIFGLLALYDVYILLSVVDPALQPALDAEVFSPVVIDCSLASVGFLVVIGLSLVLAPLTPVRRRRRAY